MAVAVGVFAVVAVANEDHCGHEGKDAYDRRRPSRDTGEASTHRVGRLCLHIALLSVNALSLWNQAD